MYDFFMSHSKTVKESIASPIVQSLSKIGFVPWIDRQEISAGDHIYNNIKQVLAEVKYGIAIIDSVYLHSDWTMQELELLHQREMIEERILIIPIFVSIEKIDVYQIVPWLEGRAFEKVNCEYFSMLNNLDCFSRMITRFYNDHISIKTLDNILPLLINLQPPCKNALIELIKAKYYFSLDMRLAIIELCNIQGLIYGIYIDLVGKDNKVITTAHSFANILQDFCFNNTYILNYNVYFSFYKAVLASATELINGLNLM